MLSQAEELLVNKLIEKGWHISCAESCTGGQIAARIVNVANASRVLSVSFVTYADEAKMKYLGVLSETIRRHHVVSEPVAREMAIGVAKESGSEIGLSTTGLAGPGGGTESIPVGTVCFGFYLNGYTETTTIHFPEASRNEVREHSTEYALQHLLELLEG